MNDLVTTRRGKARLTFVQLQAEMQKTENWRYNPSSTFRWVAMHIYTDINVGGPVEYKAIGIRYYRTQQLAEAFAKSNFRVYVVGKVKGFL